MSEASSSRLPVTLRALRHRNFQLFFSGQLVSLTGTWMQTAAEAWLVYRLTHSAWWLGVIGFASQFPVFVAAPIGGIIADRYNRHKVVICTQIFAMIFDSVLAVLTLAKVVTVEHVLILAMLSAIVC